MHYKPKFVCAEDTCRRVFKHHFHESNEYFREESSNRWYWRKRLPICQSDWKYLSTEPEPGGSIIKSKGYSPPPDSFEPLDELRCSICKKPGKIVGSKFEAPPVKDEKAWKEIQRLLDDGEEFSSCPSVEGNLELLREGSRVFCRGNDGGRWAEERSRRVMEIKAAMVRGKVAGSN